MKRAILFAMLAATVLAAPRVFGNSAYCNNNANPRVFNGTTGLAAAGNVVFEMDYKYPDAASTPFANNQVFGATVLSATSGNSPYGLADAFGKAASSSVSPGVGFRIEPIPATDASGAPSVVTLFVRDGLFQTDVAQKLLNVASDHRWHHLTFTAILHPGPGTGIGSGVDFRPGLAFSIDGTLIDRAVVGNLGSIGLGTLLCGTTMSSNTTGNGSAAINRAIRFDNLRINGRLLDSFENESGTIGTGGAAWPTGAGGIAAQANGLANWLIPGGNLAQYQIDGPGTPGGQTDGSARQSNALQGSIFLNSADPACIVAADRSAAGADDLDFKIDFMFPEAIEEPSSSGIAFSVTARMAGEFGGGSVFPAENRPGIECKVSVSADAGGFLRAEVIDRTTSRSAGRSLGTFASRIPFDLKWHRLNFTLVQTGVSVKIDEASLGLYSPLAIPIPGETDGENFAVAVNPGTGGSAERNPRFDNITIASAANGGAFGAPVEIDDFSTYLPIELTTQSIGAAGLTASGSDLRANPAGTVYPDTPWLNGQAAGSQPGASHPALFRMTEVVSRFGLNAVPGWTLY